MATYPPPNFQEPLPIFNPINWEVQVSSNVSIDYLNANYLKFPVAQGLETFSDTITNNDALFAGNITMTGTPLVNYIEFPDGTQQFTANSSGSGYATIAGNNAFTGGNSFSAPATSQSFNNQTVYINGGSINLRTSGNLYPISISNQSTSSADNELIFQPNIFQDAGTYKFQTYESGYVNRAVIDYTGIQLVGTPFKSNLNTIPTLTQLPTGYSCFHSNSSNPYFTYNNAGTLVSKSLYQTTLLGTFTSTAGLITSGIINWSFQIPNNTLGQQFSFLIVCNSSKTNSNTPYLTNSLLQLNSQITNATACFGNAILLPFQYSNGATPVPIIYNTSGYALSAYSNIGGFSINSTIIDQTTTGMDYNVSAVIANNPYTSGSTLTLYAYTTLI